MINDYYNDEKRNPQIEPLGSDAAFSQHRKNLTAWLEEKDCQYFFTGTFREDYSVDSAYRALTRFFSSRHYRPEFAFLCVELGKMYGRVHTHGVLRYPEKGIFHPTGHVFRGWYERYGRARVETIRSVGGVSGYTAKYLTKDTSENYMII